MNNGEVKRTRKILLALRTMNARHARRTATAAMAMARNERKKLKRK